MTNYREILRLQSLELNNSKIAASAGVSRPTVIKILRRATAQGLDWHAAKELSDRELAERLFPQEDDKVGYAMPDYAHVHRELSKPSVTLQLLWFEYCERCRESGEIAYQLTQFKKHYRDFAVQTKATMHIHRKPGELLEVDWAGQTAALVDSDTGEIIDAYVFVATLPYSGYSYVEAFLTRDQEAWISAHVDAYIFFGGVTRILVPDNLKTGIGKNTPAEVVLNKAYQALAEHYGTAVIPTRVCTPKDKAAVESAVGIISTWILAAIREQRFFSLRELNEVIREKLHVFNHKPFQKKDGSRTTLFAQERIHLLPLPDRAFELATWRIATVAFNYHIAVDEQYYSVPYEYIKKKVDVRLTRNVVEVFFDGSRICSHVRIHGPRGQYCTVDAHMPPNHQKFIWNGERFRDWATKIGSSAATVVEAMLTGCKVEQQGYRACMALLKLADQYTPERLETACARALFYTPRPNYKAIQAILKSGQDKAPSEPATSEFGFTRGADYYGKGR